MLSQLMAHPFEPLVTTDFCFITWKSIFLVTVMSARGASELCAYMAHPFYAVFRKDKVTLWLVPTFLTKVISMYHVSQTTILSVFFCAPSTLKERALCCLGGPRALSFYLAHTVSFCMDPHLFITYGAPSIGCPVFPQNLAG